MGDSPIHITIQRPSIQMTLLKPQLISMFRGEFRGGSVDCSLISTCQVVQDIQADLITLEAALSFELNYYKPRAGIWITPAINTGVATNGNISGGIRYIFMRFIVSRAHSITRFGMELVAGAGTAGGANRYMKAGIYTDNNGEPGDLVIDFGTINSSLSGVVGWNELSFASLALSPGVYHLCYYNQNPSATTWRLLPASAFMQSGGWNPVTGGTALNALTSASSLSNGQALPASAPGGYNSITWETPLVGAFYVSSVP